MSAVYQSVNSKLVLQLAQQTILATATKEFATVISEANLILNWQEWNCFVTECRRLKDESKQKAERL